MQLLAIFLRVAAVVLFAAAALHLVLGLKADVLLGAILPDAVVRDPALDSQNRFYGTALALYGAMLFLGASNLEKYATAIRCTLLCLFAAGLARLVSILLFGMPPLPIIGLTASEILGPPLILWWLKTSLRAS